MINFDKEYILENTRVRLAPLQKDHWKHLIHFSTEEPELWTFSLFSADSSEKMKKYIHDAIAARENKTAYPFIVFDKRTNRYAGSTRFYGIQNKDLTLQLGFTWYGKEFQGTGINKNCKFLLLEFAFDKLKMERVEFRADTKNLRSIRAMKSIGCVPEGILRSNAYRLDGSRRDSIVLSILKKEWDRAVKHKLRESFDPSDV